jgi:hypothetical protein
MTNRKNKFRIFRAFRSYYIWFTARDRFSGITKRRLGLKNVVEIRHEIKVRKERR